MRFRSLLQNWCEKSVVAADPPAAIIPRNPLFDTTGYLIPSYGRSLSEMPNGKLVVFGLPKSGNVWLVSMLCDYFDSESIDPIVDVSKQGIGMCHLAFGQEITSRLDFIHGVYLLRDLRDVVVSYFHNCQTDWFKRSMPNFHYDDMESFYFEWFVPRVVPFHGVADHARKFACAGLPVVRYEKLCEQPQEELSRLLKRLGMTVDEDRIAEVVSKNSFDELKKSGRQLNVFVPGTHFRRGGPGSYKAELPSSVLRHLSETYRSALFDWGYDPAGPLETPARDRSKAE